MNYPYTIIFIGPHGSGKGTQITKLSTVMRATHPRERVVAIQTGRLFRALAQQESYTARHVNETLNTGIWQPDFLTTALWGEVMMRDVDPICHLLIDGFPRTRAQAEVLQGAFDFYKRKNITVVALNVSDEVVRVRMKSRARLDDTKEVIEKRLHLYNQETPVVLNFYRARPHTTMLDIDAADTIEAIHQAIVHGLGLYS